MLMLLHKGDSMNSLNSNPCTKNLLVSIKTMALSNLSQLIDGELISKLIAYTLIVTKVTPG